MNTRSTSKIRKRIEAKGNMERSPSKQPKIDMQKLRKTATSFKEANEL